MEGKKKDLNSYEPQFNTKVFSRKKHAQSIREIIKDEDNKTTLIKENDDLLFNNE